MKSFIAAAIVAFAYAQDDAEAAPAEPEVVRNADLPALDAANYAAAADDCDALLDGVFGGPAKTVVTRGSNKCDEACASDDAFARAQDAALCGCLSACNGAEEADPACAVACECDAGTTTEGCSESGAASLMAGATLALTAALLY